MKYLASALSTRTGKYVSYVGNPKLMNSVMAKIPVLLPSYSEQKAIAAVLDTHDTRIHAEEAGLEKLRHVKRGLMDDLLTYRASAGFASLIELQRGIASPHP
jgi:type I restriction enzyme S subunit